MREFLIDFETMAIVAKDEKEAREKAKTFLNSGIVPIIDTVIDNGEAK